MDVLQYLYFFTLLSLHIVNKTKEEIWLE